MINNSIPLKTTALITIFFAMEPTAFIILFAVERDASDVGLPLVGNNLLTAVTFENNCFVLSRALCLSWPAPASFFVSNLEFISAVSILFVSLFIAFNIKLQ